MATEADPVLLAARPLRESLYGELIWSRPGLFRRELKLESGSETLATLRWEKLLSFEALAESADGRWRIGRHRLGSLRGDVVVRDAATEEPLATLTRGWRRTGELRFASGAGFTWGRAGFWRTEWFWSSADQPRLVTFRSRLGFQSRYEMEVDPAAMRLRELPILVLLGAYLMALVSRQRSSH